MSSRTLAIRERIASAEREISQSSETDTEEKYDRLIKDYHKCMDMYENVIESDYEKIRELNAKVAENATQITQLMNAENQVEVEEKKKCECVQAMMWASLGTALIGLFVTQFFPKKKT